MFAGVGIYEPQVEMDASNTVSTHGSGTDCCTGLLYRGTTGTCAELESSSDSAVLVHLYAREPRVSCAQAANGRTHAGGVQV